ncbi:Hypothetical protein NTJ_03786 [Nesidiocoris tenuis]|uniref:Uncharacterized protein n=1 Tax=Nesidiocoris tenuis TaxID=355587 RepID=A0ABN7AG08_9HEMI|nr:Hypothetical protein NTJ_03786 [Nesidiocoris tenuis]
MLDGRVRCQRGTAGKENDARDSQALDKPVQPRQNESGRIEWEMEMEETKRGSGKGFAPISLRIRHVISEGCPRQPRQSNPILEIASVCKEEDRTQIWKALGKNGVRYEKT